MDFKNSQTKVNLMLAFAGESQARNRYTIGASCARKQGLAAIADVFTFTADQEKEHAAIFYNLLTELSGENIAIEGSYPVDISDSVSDLLRFAQHNEYEEHDDVYKAFEETAREEGFQKAAGAFHMIAEVEKTHGDRFGMFAELLETNTLYESDTPTHWMCLECGYIYEGTKVPERCPVCNHAQGYYIPLSLAPFMN